MSRISDTRMNAENLKRYLMDNPLVLREMVDSIVITSVNDALLNIYGVNTVEEFIEEEENPEDWWDKKWDDLYASEISALAGPDKIHYRELNDTRSDDSVFEVRLITRIVEGGEDSWNRILTVVEDITERMEAQKSLEESKTKLTLAARTAKLGYCHFDVVANEYLEVSEEYANIFGHTASAFIESFKSLEDNKEMIHPEDRGLVYSAYESDDSRAFDYRIFRKDGRIVHVREIVKTLEDEVGKRIESISTLQDITEYHQTPEALKKSERHYSSLFTNLPVGVREQDYSSVKKDIDKLRKQGVTDLRGYFNANPEVLRSMVEGIRFVGINKALMEIHGENSVEGFIRSEEHISSWWNEQWAGYFAAEIERFSGPVKIFVADTVDTGADNSQINVRLISCVVSGYEDTWERVITIVEGITEEKEKEVTLIEALDRAEIASKAKSQFLTSMSHEMRTPMNAIMGFGQLLDMNAEELLSEQQRVFVSSILEGSERLMKLIEQVLDMGEMELGRLPIHFDHIAGANIIDECLELIDQMAQKEAIKIRDMIDHKNLPVLWTDGARLRQALLNLLSNAVKYNRKNGIVTLSCEEISEHMLRFNIADTGMGVPEEKQADLFKPFERLGRESQIIGGVGIGLALTRQLMELLGGKVGFQSEEGKGSAFWIEVPISRGQTTTSKITTTPKMAH